jgi:signal transduction histidine kinase/ligand-binding sensor domain-containing protein/DNA-binding response OmpR family regulator
MPRHLAPFLYAVVALFLATTAWGQENAKNIRFINVGLQDGLSQSSVFSLQQDYLGFMWIGTRDGLNRYDSRKFHTYRNAPSDSNSLTDNYILSLLEDRNKNLWVGTRSGLNRYDRLRDKFIRIPLLSNNANSPTYPMVWTISEDKQGRICMGTNHGFYRYENERFRLIFDATRYPELPAGCNNVQAVFQDDQNQTWLGTASGVVLLTTEGKLIRHFKKGPGELNSEFVRAIAEIRPGVLWFGTQEGGLNTYDSRRDHFSYTLHRPEAKAKSLAGNDVRSITKDRFGGYWIGTINGLNFYTEKDGFSTFTANDYDQFSLSNNSIRPIYQDQRGSVWVGTYFGGVNVYDRHLPNFQNHSRIPSTNSLSYNVVGGILEDEKGNLWVGTEGGGLNYMEDQKFKHFKHDPTVPGTLSHNHVKSLYLDPKGDLWIGTYNGGLNLLRKGSPQFETFRHDPADPRSLSHDNVYAISGDRHGNVWLGTYGGGINLVRPGSGMRFENFRVSSSLVRTVFVDSKDNLWVGTEDGLNVLRPGKKTFEVFRYEAQNPKSISGNVVISIFEDSQKRLWFGTYKNGLNLLLKDGKSFQHFTENEGLPGNNIFALLEDKGLLWLSTNQGICSLDPTSGKVSTYNSRDGIGGNEFSVGAACKSRSGKLYFGGIHGMTSFYAANVQPSAYVPPVRFTDFKLFNEPVLPGSSSVLKKPIFITDTLTLTHRENIFTVEFSSLNYILSDKNRFAYRLQGLENQWNYVDVPSATYTNLHPGTYTLLAKGSSNDGIWNDVPTRLTIRILPPPWKTWWAYTAYFVLAVGSLYLIIRYTRIKTRLEHQLALEHLENERQKEINEIKLNFFTSISHEFRTPLTLILAPVQHLLTQKHLDENARKLMNTVKSNSLRLLNLVNQLLDFRKQEAGSLQLQLSSQDLLPFLDQIAAEFTHYAEDRGIQFVYKKPLGHLTVQIDRDQFEKVIYNLLSNAFKFSPETRGKVLLEAYGEGANAVVQVRDNGPGIPADQQESIFELFYQLPEKKVHLGTGIGLALAKNLTELHGGKIAVESQVIGETYTSFTVRIPLEASEVTGHTVSRTEYAPIAEKTSENTPETGGNADLPLVLVVEDNAEIRHLISSILHDHYRIIEAENGLDGWEKVKGHLPDLVISDIMMPVEDGLSLLRKIKKSIETSHIPVLLLTARTAMESVLEGLQSGSDDYLTKPYHPEVLALKIKNMLGARERFRKKFIRDYVLAPQQEALEPDLDQEFLRKVIHLIEENLSEPEFNVNVLAKELSMSRPVLYRKLKQLTDLSVIELINVLRLKKAAQLLMQRHAKVSQVAYQIGFSDPKYFSKTFKGHFGMSPTEFGEMDAEEQSALIAKRFKNTDSAV